MALKSTSRAALRAAFLLFPPALLWGCGSYRVRWQGVELPPSAASRTHPEGDEASRAVRYNNLGVYFERQGEPEKALDYYRRARELDPFLTVARINAGNVNLRMGNLPAAAARYREALEIEQDHPRALNNLAWVYLQQGEKVEESLVLARRAIEADPDHRYLYLDTLGWALWKAGRTAEALQTLEEAREITPEEEAYLLGMTHYHLGVIHGEMGEGETAARHLRRSLEYRPSPELERKIRMLLEE